MLGRRQERGLQRNACRLPQASSDGFRIRRYGTYARVTRDDGGKDGRKRRQQEPLNKRRAIREFERARERWPEADPTNPKPIAAGARRPQCDGTIRPRNRSGGNRIRSVKKLRYGSAEWTLRDAVDERTAHDLRSDSADRQRGGETLHADHEHKSPLRTRRTHHSRDEPRCAETIRARLRACAPASAAGRTPMRLTCATMLSCSVDLTVNAGPPEGRFPAAPNPAKQRTFGHSQSRSVYLARPHRAPPRYRARSHPILPISSYSPRTSEGHSPQRGRRRSRTAGCQASPEPRTGCHEKPDTGPEHRRIQMHELRRRLSGDTAMANCGRRPRPAPGVAS